MIRGKWGVSVTFYRKRAFPVLAGLLWLAFLTLDLTGWGSSTQVKFAAICLCWFTALLGAKTPESRPVAAALCFTVVADWLLLVADEHYALGVGLFLVVQALYAYRLYLWRGKKPCKWGLALRLVGLALALYPFLSSLIYVSAAFITWGRNPELVDFLARFLPSDAMLYVAFPLFYFLNLCINAAEAFNLKKRAFAWGLLLFIFCDICVGLSNLHLYYFPPPLWLRDFAQVGMWFFYLPSQVLIVLSQEEGERYEKAL